MANDGVAGLVLYDARMCAHQNGSNSEHLEQPARISSIYQCFKSAGIVARSGPRTLYAKSGWCSQQASTRFADLPRSLERAPRRNPDGKIESTKNNNSGSIKQENRTLMVHNFHKEECGIRSGSFSSCLFSPSYNLGLGVRGGPP
ncbi:unnamed protein product [Sphagnum jensenii]|uniref:Uncharacterized protein n=1 Tax=Sphagnum jensenii TaxID=128206 RepID=A0ABP0XCV9_9BRYO